MKAPIDDHRRLGCQGRADRQTDARSRAGHQRELELTGRIPFIQEAERLKNVLRSAHTSTGRRESTAEHTWRLCLMALTFEDQLGTVDFAKILKLCVVHDLGEAISGDVPATEQESAPNKSERERQDLQQLDTPGSVAG
jgi:putative hydrolases of HD superfamily